MNVRRRTTAGDLKALAAYQAKQARRYQYGTQCEYTNAEGQVITQRVYEQPSRAIAEEVARDWCISPLRNGPRYAHLMRRRGWDGEWAPIADWASPEAPR